MKELWKYINEFEGYQVSNTGKIRTRRSPGIKKDFMDSYKEMTPEENKKGYLQINLIKDGKYYRKMIHRLVLQAFGITTNILNAQVDHIDCNKKNNHINNLEWVSPKENVSRSIKNGLNKNNHKLSLDDIKKGNAKRMKKVKAKNIKTGKILSFNSLAEAARKLDLNKVNISSVLNGRQSTTGGCWTFYYNSEE